MRAALGKFVVAAAVVGAGRRPRRRGAAAPPPRPATCSCTWGSWRPRLSGRSSGWCALVLLQVGFRAHELRHDLLTIPRCSSSSSSNRNMPSYFSTSIILELCIPQSYVSKCVVGRTSRSRMWSHLNRNMQPMLLSVFGRIFKKITTDRILRILECSERLQQHCLCERTALWKKCVWNGNG